MRIIPYRKVSDLEALSRDFVDRTEKGRVRFKNGVRFIVPSRRDRDWWRIRAGLLDYGLSEHVSEADDLVYLWNWEDLYNDICSFCKVPALRQIDPPDHRLILFHIVREFLKDHKDGPELLQSWPGLARSGFIDILSDDIRELINEAVSPSQLSVTERDDAPTSLILPWLYERYIAYLSKYRLMDSAQIPLASLELLEGGAEAWVKDKMLVFVGFMSFTHGQLALLNKLEALSSDGIIILKPAAELKNFQDATQQLEGKTWEDDPPLTHGTVVSLRSSELGLESEMIARSLALWYSGKGTLSKKGGIFPGFGAMGMAVPAERTVSMEAALRRYRIPYSLAHGRSIGEGFIGATLSALWSAWLQGLEAYETALLLAHPCFADEGFSIDDAALAGPRGINAWQAYLSNVKENGKKNTTRPLKAFKAMIKFCRTVEKGDSPAGLFKAFHAFLTTPGLWLDALTDFSVNSPDLDESLRELAASVAEVQAKYLALRELQPDIGAAGKVVLRGKEAADFLKNWCEDTRIQSSPPMAGALVLYAGAAPILASYPVWIMTDVTQKNWPGVIRSSPLLDASERDAMRSVSVYLPSVHDKRMQKEALFRRLLQAGDVLTITTSANVDEEDRPLGITPFMASFIDDMKYWEYSEAPVVTLDGLTPEVSGWRFPAIEAGPSERRERDIPAIRGSAEKLRLPVSSLYELLECPLRYWLKRSANLKERKTALFSEADAGILTHKIWETVWRRRQDGEGLRTVRSLAAEEWQKLISSEGIYAPFCRLTKDRRLSRYVKNMEFYVMRLADLQQNILDRLSDMGLRHTELKTEMELTPCEVDGVVFTGRCDRVEVFSDNRVVIVDYKWGRSAAYEKKLDTVKYSFKYGLQLSAYAFMYSSAYPSRSIAGVGFLGHRDGAIAGSFEPSAALCYLPSKQNAAILEERTAEALEAMQRAASILKSRQYEPSYSADACRYCDVKGVCRKGELMGENFVLDDNNEEKDE